MELLLFVGLLLIFDGLSLSCARDSRHAYRSAEHNLALHGYTWPE